MKPQLLLMSHGQMAAETFASAQMIVGELANVKVISMAADDGLSGTQIKLDQVIQEIPREQEIIIITDLKGGTPCNVAMMKMAACKNIHVLSGLNLAMVIEASISPIKDANQLVNHLETIGKEAVTTVVLPELEEEEYED